MGFQFSVHLVSVLAPDILDVGMDLGVLDCLLVRRGGVLAVGPVNQPLCCRAGLQVLPVRATLRQQLDQRVLDRAVSGHLLTDVLDVPEHALNLCRVLALHLTVDGGQDRAGPVAQHVDQAIVDALLRHVQLELRHVLRATVLVHRQLLLTCCGADPLADVRRQPLSDLGVGLQHLEQAWVGLDLWQQMLADRCLHAAEVLRLLGVGLAGDTVEPFGQGLHLGQERVLVAAVVGELGCFRVGCRVSQPCLHTLCVGTLLRCLGLVLESFQPVVQLAGVGALVVVQHALGLIRRGTCQRVLVAAEHTVADVLERAGRGVLHALQVLDGSVSRLALLHRALGFTQLVRGPDQPLIGLVPGVLGSGLDVGLPLLRHRGVVDDVRSHLPHRCGAFY